jgi:hypothetical protein
MPSLLQRRYIPNHKTINMKLILATALLAIAGCNSADKAENASMPGTYKMLSQSVKGAKVDTTYTGLQQLKMYSDDYMMYAHFTTADSVSAFGIGSYTVSKDTVTENVVYNANDTAKNDMPASFKLAITKTEKGYKQLISGIQWGDQQISLTEDYETVGTATKSPLDGAWKMIKSYSIVGKDTTAGTGTQFKMYSNGYFIFGNTYSDSAKKNHTGMGYGKFAMTGTNKSKESVMVSTYYEIRGKDVDLDIEMNGADEYKQTIKWDNSIGVEIYQRMKK